MVGKRSRNFFHEAGKTTGRTNGTERNGDLERGPMASGGNSKPRVFRFKDVANTALENSRREELKKQLLFGLEQVDLERFRKTDQDVRFDLSKIHYCAHLNANVLEI